MILHAIPTHTLLSYTVGVVVVLAPTLSSSSTLLILTMTGQWSDPQNSGAVLSAPPPTISTDSKAGSEDGEQRRRSILRARLARQERRF